MDFVVLDNIANRLAVGGFQAVFAELVLSLLFMDALFDFSCNGAGEYKRHYDGPE